MTYTHDFAPFKMDNKTMEGGNRCGIMLDKVNTQLERCPKLDKRGREVPERIEEGANESGSAQGSVEGSLGALSAASGGGSEA